MKRYIFLLVLQAIISTNGYGQALFFKEKNVEIERSKASVVTKRVIIECDNNSLHEMRNYTISVRVDFKTSTLNQNQFTIDFHPLEGKDLKVDNPLYISVKPDSVADRVRYIYLHIVVKDAEGKVVHDNNIYCPKPLAMKVIPAEQIGLSYETRVDTLKEYLDKHKLGFVTDVKSDHNILTINGYVKKDEGKKYEKLKSRKVILGEGQVFTVKNMKYGWCPEISLMATPYKIRSETKMLPRKTVSGLSSVGLNLTFLKLSFDRYFFNGKKSTHSFGLLGIWLAPSVEKMDSASTAGYLGASTTSQELFISTGLTFTYNYNGVSFSYIPIGIDWPTTTIGENFIYQGKRWWGFGLGIDLKVLSGKLNK